MTAETCYPVKVSHGHVKAIAGKTQYLFLPIMIDMPTPHADETGFYCPFVQSNYHMVQVALDLDKNTTLRPVVHLKQDAETLALVLSDVLTPKLGVSRARIQRAWEYGLERHKKFLGEMYEQGQEIIENYGTDAPLVVVTGRPYNLYDERLNLRLGQNLTKIGLSALPMDFVNVSSVNLSDFPSMYWGLGAQILRTTKWVKENPNYFGLHITNFSCGPDSFVEHFYKYVMGEKPYLILELDEHSAVAGVMTRLEAFKNVIDNTMHKWKREMLADLKLAN
jgi:predicted nucleotide-binding protein (sugar kinase/HSP70/actin superfamily)